MGLHHFVTLSKMKVILSFLNILLITRVILWFLKRKRERDFANVTNSSAFLSVLRTFLFEDSLKTLKSGHETVRNVHA
jgi:hypothetical protein